MSMHERYNKQSTVWTDKFYLASQQFPESFAVFQILCCGMASDRPYLMGLPTERLIHYSDVMNIFVCANEEP